MAKASEVFLSGEQRNIEKTKSVGNACEKKISVGNACGVQYLLVWIFRFVFEIVFEILMKPEFSIETQLGKYRNYTTL
jgi:hypothetical protein